MKSCRKIRYLRRVRRGNPRAVEGGGACHSKAAVIEAVGSLFHKDKRVARFDNRRFFGVKLPRKHPGECGVKRLAHRDAAHDGIFLALHGDCPLVPRTPENPGTFAGIGPKRAVIQVRGGIPIAGIAEIQSRGRRIGQVASDPSRTSCVVSDGVHDTVPIVIGIHAPTERELPVVVKALNADGFQFGLAQSRQQHRRQNGDDGDDHQQFNERESALKGICAVVDVFH